MLGLAFHLFFSLSARLCCCAGLSKPSLAARPPEELALFFFDPHAEATRQESGLVAPIVQRPAELHTWQHISAAADEPPWPVDYLTGVRASMLGYYDLGG